MKLNSADLELIDYALRRPGFSKAIQNALPEQPTLSRKLDAKFVKWFCRTTGSGYEQDGIDQVLSHLATHGVIVFDGTTVSRPLSPPVQMAPQL